MTQFNHVIFSAIRGVQYNGRGSLTGQAIQFTANTTLRASQGRRTGIPAVVVVITDGMLSCKYYMHTRIYTGSTHYSPGIQQSTLLWAVIPLLSDAGAKWVSNMIYTSL